ncbi:sucrose-6-phosphate hydrolase [Cytobacillus firmus]|uniref:sucrose-6-phosphate hydrolase n=1 Tax=Cytobacillus firmus TaxID=1399 RepID=UPI0018CD5AB3|nr:sucrose-6-phosphate hydrolase [Cytobacillus firmus]MBG9658021.1 sucrose-6-phosphate hydrolase [Cytobacillus firmus]MDD9309886.1 sucrose-6-phosphate hydrolase [Cytobacillus firmus]MED1907902.1 sucrose-6-phosphate hydrolase [Cytobacillus firmus]
MTEIDFFKKASEEAERNRHLVRQDPNRLKYHLMPPVGLLNDPNGLIQFKGTYHVFYQWNPFDTAHGAKYWGHYTSRNLIHWKEEPIALAPDQWYDRNGCYSGSAIEFDGKLYLFYTGNVKNEDGRRETYQCLAVSEDGIHFDKKGPVLELPKGYTAHFRDPKVWEKNGSFYMIVGAQTLKQEGAAVLFASKDLYHWEEKGKIAGAWMNGLEDFGYMWECPDLFELDGQEILLVSPQGLEPSGYEYHNLFQSGYFAGKLDYEKAIFNHGSFAELDRGFDFYAPQTFKDDSGRRILYGWMGITDEDESSQPTVSYRWIHALTMPRVLDMKNGRLIQIPVEELKKLRKDKTELHDVEINGERLQLDGIGGKTAELLLKFFKNIRFKMDFRNEASLTYNPDQKEIQLHRRNVRTGMQESRICKISSLSKLHVFMDQSSLEIFINGGEEVFTARYFPDPEDETIFFSGDAGFSVSMWNLEDK